MITGAEGGGERDAANEVSQEGPTHHQNIKIIQNIWIYLYSSFAATGQKHFRVPPLSCLTCCKTQDAELKVNHRALGSKYDDGC